MIAPGDPNRIQEERKRGGRLVRVRVQRLVIMFVWAVGILLFLVFFSTAKVILLGLLAAATFAAALRPVVEWLRGPRWLGALVAAGLPALIFGGLIALLSWLLAAPLVQQIRKLPQLRHDLNQSLAQLSNRVGLDEPVTVQSLGAQVLAFLGGTGQDVLSLTANLVSGLVVALAFLFFGSLFMLTEPPGRLSEPVVRLLPPGQQSRLRAVFRDLEPRLRWWLLGTLFTMTVTGLTSWVGYGAILGFQTAVPLAIIAAIAELVPTVGPMLAFGVVALVAATQGGWELLGVAAVYVVLQALESYVLYPLVMRGAVRIPPVVTLFSVVLWGMVFGLPGLLLALPIDLVIWSVAEHLFMQPKREAEAREKKPEPRTPKPEEVEPPRAEVAGEG